jgi:hypothetical protein
MLKRGRKRGSRMQKGKSGQRSVQLGKFIRRIIYSKRGYYKEELKIYAIYTKFLSLF